MQGGEATHTLKEVSKTRAPMRANNSPPGGYNRRSPESIRRLNCLCAAKTLFDLGGERNPPSCPELDDRPESRDGEREESGL